MNLPLLKKQNDIWRIIFSLFMLLWFSVTTVGMLAADLKSSHPDCKCGCQTGQTCQVKQGSCCQKQAGSCCSSKSTCCQNEAQPPSYRADCQCGNNSLDQIVLSKPYDLATQPPGLLISPDLEADFDVLALLPQHQDAPQTPPPELI